MRLLLVEDEAGIALAHAGFAAEHMADGASAWERGGTEPFTAAILDLNLPAIDGLSLLRRWRAEGVGFPILVLSARSTWSVRVEAIDADADDYLVKPFAMKELLARLARHPAARCGPGGQCAIRRRPGARHARPAAEAGGRGGGTHAAWPTCCTMRAAPCMLDKAGQPRCQSPLRPPQADRRTCLRHHQGRHRLQPLQPPRPRQRRQKVDDDRAGLQLAAGCTARASPDLNSTANAIPTAC